MPQVSRRGTHVVSSLRPFELSQATDSGLTSFAGLPAVLETWAALGMPEVVQRELRLKKIDRGPSEAEWVEVLTVLPLAGGKTVEDLRIFKEDSGLMRLWPLLGKVSPRSALQFLERFHDERQEPSTIGHAVIRPDTPALAALARINRALVGAVQKHKPEELATVDIDASVHPCRKREALPAYEGGRAYQPLTAVWAERRLLLEDEFRDGNVPAGMGNLPFLQRVHANLPKSIKRLFVRADTALYEQDVLSYLVKENIEFAISADITPQLRQAIQALPKTAWQPLRDDDGVIREEGRLWAEVEYVPEDKRPGTGKPLRYLAIHLPQQADLFESPRAKYVAIVSNRWEVPGNDLINWQRKKCGTIEYMHDLLKNDFAARSFPSGKFGSNAAWYRFNVLANNLLVACTTLAFEDTTWTKIRPTTFAFRFLRRAGRVISHAGSLFLMLSTLSTGLLQVYETARGALAAVASSG
jgi:hypothetical protein